MRNIDLIDKEIQPLHSEVLIAIEDTFDIKTSKGGILMANAAHEEAEADSAGYTLSDWIIRYGTVARLPRMINKAGYDWKTELEIGEGDIVFWNISRAFRNPVLKTLDGNLYTLINYHEIHAKKKGEEITPVNGFCLFRNIKKEKVPVLEPLVFRWCLHVKAVPPGVGLPATVQQHFPHGGLHGLLGIADCFRRLAHLSIGQRGRPG